jgi:hypothetical protein
MSQRNWDADGVTPDNEHHGRHRARKNTKLWCKGKVGRAHDWGIRSWARRYGLTNRVCGPVASGTTYGRPTRITWTCYEERFCRVCGKVQGFIPVTECTHLSQPHPVASGGGR